MNVPQRAEDLDLGQQIAEFRPPKETLAAITFLLFGLFCAGVAVLAELGGLRGVWIMAGVGILIVVAIVVYLINRRGTRNLTIFLDGFVYGANSEKPEIMRWQDVDEYRVRVLQKLFITPYSIHMRGDYLFTLRSKDGTTISIKEHYPDISVLAQLMWKFLQDKLGPPALGDFQQGQTLSFGPISVSMKGIDKGQEMLPWDQVVRIVIQYGKVVVQTQVGKRYMDWVKIRVEDIPNLPVFVAVIASPQVNKLREEIDLARTTIGL